MNLASTLDAAILKPEFSEAEVAAAMRECLPYKPATLCVRPCDIPQVKPACREHGVGLCVVLGFPHGCQLTASKADEARAYLDLGAEEIDMVCNIGRVRSGLWEQVREDIAVVSRLTRPAGVPLKVIFETRFLNAVQIARLVEVCVEAEADYVKTSTGFNGEGARDEDVRLMIETAQNRIMVKPSGGIRTRERAEALIAMGAARLGVGYGSVAALCGGGGTGEGY